MTRIPALKAVSAVASSSLQLDVAAALSTVAADISVFLRQSSRVLKQTTLVTLQAIICSSASRRATLPASTVCAVLREVAQLLTDSDMNITDLSLRVTHSTLSLFHHDPQVTPLILSEVLTRAVNLACSALMQGHAQKCIAGIRDCVESNRSDKRVVGAAVTSMRFVFATYKHNYSSSSSSSGGGGGNDGIVSPDHISFFLSFLADESIDVRRATLLMANAAMHYNAHLVVDFIESSIVPHLLSTLSFKQERVVDLGPFKHKVQHTQHTNI